jgi:hypothetical protein
MKEHSVMQSEIIRDIRLKGFTIAERNEKRGDFYTVIARCLACRVWHTHTGFKTLLEPGAVQLHRYPHCDNENYRSRKLYDGYIIDIVGPATLQVVADYQRQNPAV